MERLVGVSLGRTHVQKLQSYGLPAAWAPDGRGALVDPWLRDLLSVGLEVDDALLTAMVRVRDDPELREACLAAVALAPEENCGKAVALGRLLGVPLPSWMEWSAALRFREYGGKQWRNRPADPVSAALPEPTEARPWPF